MLQDTDLTAIEHRLQDFQRQEQGRHDTLTALLKHHESLLEDYRSLKSDYEEEKEGREKYKRLAKGVGPVASSSNNGDATSSKPFVLMLVDGNRYLFSDHLLKADEDGGTRAAFALHGAIQRQLGHHGLEGCEIVVRVYADFVSLSKSLTAAKLIKPHKRAIASFAAGFTQARPLFDFVDSGEGSDCTFGKISGMSNLTTVSMSLLRCQPESLRLFAQGQMTGHADRHVLFAGCHDPRYAPLLQHTRKATKAITLIRGPRLRPEFEDMSLNVQAFPEVFQTVGQSDSISSAFSAASSRVHESSASQRATPSQNPASRLPFITASREGLIPINAIGQRLDVQVPKPSDEAQRAFEALSPKPCNNHQLEGECSRTQCVYSHEYTTAEIKDIMRRRARVIGCPHGTRCRTKNCFFGHVCIKTACLSKKSTQCKLRTGMHDVDLNVEEWVPPKDDTGNDTRGWDRPVDSSSPTISGNRNLIWASNDWRRSSPERPSVSSWDHPSSSQDDPFTRSGHASHLSFDLLSESG